MHIDDGIYVFEASELRWPPGQFPRTFDYDGKIFHFASLRKNSEGDVLDWTYIAGNYIARVFND